MDSSPAQRLLGRRCKTLLPTTTELLRPQSIQRDKVRNQIKRRQTKQAHYYNKGAKDLPALEGDVVRMGQFKLGQKTWDPATVTRRYGDRFYEVETDTGNYRRNNSCWSAAKDHNPWWWSTNACKPIMSKKQAIEPSSMATETLNNKTEDLKPEVTQRPRRTTKEPSYLKDWVTKWFNEQSINTMNNVIFDYIFKVSVILIQEHRMYFVYCQLGFQLTYSATYVIAWSRGSKWANKSRACEKRECGSHYFLHY